MIEWFIAFRYFRTGRGSGMITAISVISFLGIMLGTAALIVVLGVFNGFSSLVQGFLLSTEPDARIILKEDVPATKRTELLKKCEQYNMASSTPFVYGTVLLMKDNFRTIVTLKGIEEQALENVYRLKDKLAGGIPEFSKDISTSSAFIGIFLADKLGALPGDTLFVVSPEGVERVMATGSGTPVRKLVVNGVFKSDNSENDGSLVFTDTETGVMLFPSGSNEGIMGYEVTLKNREEAEQFKSAIEKEFSFASVKTYRDMRKELFSVMELERFVATILLSLIIVVAVFNILASLTMSVVKKKRDIGVMLSMGLKQSAVRRIFFLQGLIAGCIGTVCGFALALFVWWLQINYKIYPLDPSKFKLDAMPMELRITDFIIVGSVSLLLSALAAIYPANKAAATDPINAIRWE